MDSRGTGLRPQRPAGWEKTGMISISATGPNAAPQGPAKGPAVTSRSMQAPIPGDSVGALQQGGGFLAQQLAGRPGMSVERAKPGDDSNVSSSGFVASGGPMTTKGGVLGSTSGTPHFGASKGGF